MERRPTNMPRERTLSCCHCYRGTREGGQRTTRTGPLAGHYRGEGGTWNRARHPRCVLNLIAPQTTAQLLPPAQGIPPTCTKNPGRTRTKVKPGSVHYPPEIHLAELTVECSRLRHRAVGGIFERARQHFGRAGEVEIRWSVSGQEPCGATSIRSVWSNRDCMDERAGASGT